MHTRLTEITGRFETESLVVSFRLDGSTKALSLVVVTAISSGTPPFPFLSP